MATFFLTIVFLINFSALFISLINFFALKRPGSARIINDKVAVLLPVRNEIENIERIVTELRAQKYFGELDIYIIDDHSSDGTTEFLKTHVAEQITVITPPQLPKGWLGKPFALHSGYLAARSEKYEIYITIDADLYLKDDSLARAISALDESDFISPYPHQRALGVAERLIQPLLQWSWMSSVILPLSNRFQHPSTAIANGQFFIVRGKVLERLNGFTPVADKVLDDIQFTKAAIRAGYKGRVIEGSTIAQTRMYSSLSQIQSGYGKSLYPTFGFIGSIVLAIFIFLTSIFPFFFIATPLGFLAATSIIGTRVVTALSSRNRIIDSIWHPFSAALFISLLFYSWRKRGTIEWKGRTV